MSLEKKLGDDFFARVEEKASQMSRYEKARDRFRLKLYQVMERLYIHFL